MARAPSVADGRATEVFLTAQGARLVARLHEQTRQALAPLTERLGAPDQQRLQELLERMLEGGAGARPAP